MAPDKRSFVDTDVDTVSRMKLEGKTQQEICDALDISRSTLNRRFGHVQRRTKRGNPPARFTEGEREMANLAAMYGLPNAMIAQKLKISISCLEKHLLPGMREASAEGGFELLQTMHQKAVDDGDVGAGKFLITKRIEGYGDTVAIDIGGVSMDAAISDSRLEYIRQLSPEGRQHLKEAMLELQEIESAAQAVEVIEAEVLR